MIIITFVFWHLFCEMPEKLCEMPSFSENEELSADHEAMGKMGVRLQVFI